MPKNGDLIKLKESQIIALQLQKEKLTETQKLHEEYMLILEERWAMLLTLIGQELEIPREEAENWYITERMNAFEYKAPPENKEINGG